MKQDNINGYASILIVDDNMDNIQVLGGILKSEGQNVEFAIVGRSALDWVEKQKFDIILLDINMPGMDGYTAVKLIRETKTAIPVIAQTAYAEDKEKAIKSGCSGFISKPFDKKGLLKIIHELI